MNTDEARLRIGIPKGSLQETTRKLFDLAGFDLRISGRSYYPDPFPFPLSFLFSYPYSIVIIVLFLLLPLPLLLIFLLFLILLLFFIFYVILFLTYAVVIPPPSFTLSFLPSLFSSFPWSSSSYFSICFYSSSISFPPFSASSSSSSWSSSVRFSPIDLRFTLSEINPHSPVKSEKVNWKKNYAGA